MNINNYTIKHCLGISILVCIINIIICQLYLVIPNNNNIKKYLKNINDNIILSTIFLFSISLISCIIYNLLPV